MTNALVLDQVNEYEIEQVKEVFCITSRDEFVFDLESTVNFKESRYQRRSGRMRSIVGVFGTFVFVPQQIDLIGFIFPYGKFVGIECEL